MKRRHSIATSRALAQEALRVAQARKASLNERVSASKSSLSSNETNMNSGLAYENIYPAEQINSSKEEVVEETNNQILGLHRHRESEMQRRSIISQSSTLSAGGSEVIGRDIEDDREDEEHDQFAAHTNPMISSSIISRKTTSSRPPAATNARDLISGSKQQQNGVDSFEPDSSARSLEKRRRSTRFPSIKAKREVFLLRSETGSSVGSNTSSADLSASVPSANTKQTNESYGSGEGSGLSGISNTSPVTVETALSRRISRKFVGITASEEFPDKVTQFYSYNDLKRAPLLRASSSASSIGEEADPTSAPPVTAVDVEFPPGVNPKFREQYLSDLEFETIFNMSKSAFNAQPKWKKQELKKRHHLF